MGMTKTDRNLWTAFLGEAKAKLVGRNALISGLEMMAIGSAVGGAGYGIGILLGA